MVDDSNIDRRTMIRGAGLAGVAGLAGCISTQGSGGGTNTGNSTPVPVNVGMVYALGGLGDKSFNDMANQGIKEAAKKYPRVSFQNAEPSGPSEMRTLQRKFATATNPDYELVCCIGFTQTKALKENSKKYPDQRFMIVDSVVGRDNVASYVFKEHEGSFQVGHLAGLLTNTDFEHTEGGKTYSTNDDLTVGFVGGKQNVVIDRFEAGYRAGVAHANDDVDVKIAYAGSWSDPAKGKEIALSMYDEGADIVYHAAGGTGIGVFKAAKERGRLAIGVDADQSRSTDYEEVIVASMVKHVDTAVFTSVENVVKEQFRGGKTTALGLEKGGVEAVIGKSYEGELPKDITAALKQSRKAIINGKITVPSKPEDL